MGALSDHEYDVTWTPVNGPGPETLPDGTQVVADPHDWLRKILVEQFATTRGLFNDRLSDPQKNRFVEITGARPRVFTNDNSDAMAGHLDRLSPA